MIAVSAVLALALAGQTATPAAAGTAGDCQIHVWPGEGLTSIFYGFFHGGIVNGGQQGRRGYPRVPADAMSTGVQTELLAEAQPQGTLDLPGYRLVLHPEALTSRVIRAATGRIAPSSSSCYAELIVDDVVLQQDWVNGGSLRVLFRFRRFGADAQPEYSFSTWADTDLDNFPPRTEADLPGALRELRGAFQHNIAVFAEQLRRSQGRRR